MKRTIILLAVVALVAGCSSSKKEKAGSGVQQQKLLVKVQKAQRRYIAERLSYFGTVMGVRQAQIFPDMPGKLLEYKVKEGEHVKKDQVIALLDRSIPGMKYEPLVVKSPISGVVAFTYAVPGQMCAPQMPIALVVDDSRLEVQANVPPEELSKLHVGQKVVVYADRDSVMGRIKSVSAAVDPMKRVGQIKIAVNRSRLWPGMMVRAEVVLRESPDAIVVPTSAVVKSDGKTYIFVVKNGRAEMRQIETGIESDNLYEVKSGLSEGEPVVVEGAEGLSDGQLVEVAKW